jgi:hypothetical protein
MKPFGFFSTAMFIGLLLSTNRAMAQKSIPTTHTIFMTVLQDDTVKVTVFIVNGDEHDVRIADPDGNGRTEKRKNGRGEAKNFVDW